MKTVERHKKTDFGDVWYVNAADGTYRFAVYKYDDDDETIYLSNVFVKEESRRQGYGNEILTSAEDYANRLGASVICLKVLIGSDVHRWYKRHGYEDLEKDEEERGYMWMKKELKKIDESHWSEMNRRSQGITVRKEDDVDLMDASGFLEYLKKIYKNVDTPFYILTDVDGVIVVPTLTWNRRIECMRYDPEHKIVYIQYGFLRDYENELLDKIRERYDTSFGKTSNYSNQLSVKPKNGEVTNRFFIEFIDFILKNASKKRKRILMKKDNVNESHWSEMNRRSQGVAMRKEDSVDLLNADDFVLYIKKNYKIDNTPYDVKKHSSGAPEIFIPLCNSRKGRISIFGLLFDYEECVVYIPRDISKRIPNLFNKLDTNFDLWLDEPDYENFIIINPKDTKRSITNSYVIEVLNFIIDNLDDTVTPCIFRKTNESHWSEMNKRSQGTVVRKEDDLDIRYKNRISGYILTSFSENLVYEETTMNTIYSFKRFVKDYLKYDIEDNEVSEEAIDLYIDKHWNEFSKTINEKVQEENDYVKSTGFKKYMFSSIKTSFDDWWKKLDENDRDDLVYYYNQTAEEMEYETYKNADEFYEWANMRERLYGWKCLKMNESHWSEMNRRSQGLTKRREDGQKQKDTVQAHCWYFARQIVYEDAYKNDLNDFIEHFHNAWKYMTGGEKYVNAIVDYVTPRWKMFKALIDEHVEKLEKKVESQGFKKVPGESISETLNKWWDSYEYKDDELDATNNDLDTNERYRDSSEMWDSWDYDQKIECYMNDMEQTNECDGVPGGLTPVDVGGMGPAYFPGPHGEPGSGDLPMPTGKVYQQVAPYTMFLKQTKKKKKKTKKFRKEDEPCVHSENPPIYSHVDDFRDYVDRVYNQIDRKK